MKKFINKETLLYLIFGVMTTIINYSVFFLCYNLQNIPSTIANIIAFVAAVIFAYLVNKIFVFESKSWKPAVLMPEILQFLGTRIFSFLLEEAGLFISDNLLKLGRYKLFTYGTFVLDGVTFVKIVLSIAVVIINYLFCKWIFKKK
ncbi:MAG: GtrA family protein [Clostridia bacterium]|nr:GtrA family protein [Clostridia bacterium]